MEEFIKCARWGFSAWFGVRKSFEENRLGTTKLVPNSPASPIDLGLIWGTPILHYDCAKQ